MPIVALGTFSDVLVPRGEIFKNANPVYGTCTGDPLDQLCKEVRHKIMTTAVAFAACRIVRHFFVTDQAFHCDVDSPFFSESRDRLCRCSSMLVAFVS